MASTLHSHKWDSVLPNRLMIQIGVLTLLMLVGTSFETYGQTTLSGVWEGELQDPERPIVMTVDFGNLKMTGLITANLKGLTITDEEKSVTFEINLGNQTLRFTGKREAARIAGEVNTGHRTLPFWLEQLPTLPKPANRIEAWQQDIDVVISRFLRYDRSFSEPKRQAARAALMQLKQNIARMNDNAVMVALARAVAISGNAHTRLYLMRNRTEVRRVPLRVWWFGKELRIVRASNERGDLVGCRITKIGESNSFTAFQKVRGIKAGNESWQRYMSAYFLTSPDILFGAGVIPNPDHLPLTLICEGKERRVDLNPTPLHKSTAPVEAWWDLAPSYQDPSIDFKSALTLDKAPLYLRHPDLNYWVEYLSDKAIVYIQYNRSQEMPAESMPDFIHRVSALFDENQIKGLIVDVRFNTGGDLGVGRPLVDALAPRLRNVPVVVLTGRATFSAGISHTAQWKQFANAAIVGEPIGDDIDLWGEGGNLVLPNSKLTVHFANGFHKYSLKDYPAFKPYFAELAVASLQPDEVLEPNWNQYLSGRDPVLDAAIARIQQSK